jgi:hypothetical protein
MGGLYIRNVLGELLHSPIEFVAAIITIILGLGAGLKTQQP